MSKVPLYGSFRSNIFVHATAREQWHYRSYSKSRTHAALGPYGRSMPRSIGLSEGVVRVLTLE